MIVKKDSSFQKKARKFLFLSVLVVLTLTFLQEESFAIPAFSRKYQTSCTTCHTGFPKINAFGTSFKNNGYRLPEDDVFVKEPPVWLGSEAYERVWPNAVWPTNIAGTAPIALRVMSQLLYDPTQSELETGRGKLDFEFPHEIEFLAMGTMGKNLAYHLAVALQDEDERTAIEAVWLEYNDILQGKFGISEDLINMRVGFFPPMNTPFSQATERLMASRPTLTDFRISGSDQPRMRDGQAGFEFYGMPTPRLRYATGVVSGRAISTDSERFLDNNTEKDFYGRLEYKFGGLPFSGAAETGSDELSGGMTYFDQGTSVTVGGSGYYGVNQIDVSNNSTYYRITGFMRGSHDRYNLDLAYLYQNDDNAAGQVAGTDDDNIGSHGFYAETTAFLKPWIAILTRYDYLTIDHVTTLGASNPTNNTSRLTFALPIYPRPNLRLIPEVSVGTSDHRDGNKADTYQVRLDYAF